MTWLLLYTIKTVGLGVLFVTGLMLFDALGFDPDGATHEHTESKSHR